MYQYNNTITKHFKKQIKIEFKTHGVNKCHKLKKNTHNLNLHKILELECGKGY